MPHTDCGISYSREKAGKESRCLDNLKKKLNNLTLVAPAVLRRLQQVVYLLRLETCQPTIGVFPGI